MSGSSKKVFIFCDNEDNRSFICNNKLDGNNNNRSSKMTIATRTNTETIATAIMETIQSTRTYSFNHNR